VKDLNGMDVATFLTRIEEYFAVEKKGQSPYRPTEKGTFGMYLENEWYSLSVCTLRSSSPSPRMPPTKSILLSVFGSIIPKISLSAKEEIKSEDAVEGLDVSLLQNDLLDPILGIMDPPRIRHRKKLCNGCGIHRERHFHVRMYSPFQFSQSPDASQK